MPKVSFTFRGPIVPVFTPFNNDSTKSLNLSVIPQYANFLASNKVTGILVNGTTGEGPSLSLNERKAVTEAWANAIKTTKQHLMIQVGGAALPHVLELAKHAESIKADSILCLPDLYFKPTTVEELTRYLKLISSAAPNTPLLYYHIPKLTNVDIHMGQFLEYIGNAIPTFVGIKFTSDNLSEGAEALNAHNKKFAIFLGNDQLISPACALGMDSIIVTSLNMLSQLALETFNEAKAGNMFKAKEKQEKLTKGVLTIIKYGPWVESMKVAMTLLTNINVGPTREPLRALPPEVVASMAKDIQDYVKNTLSL